MDDMTTGDGGVRELTVPHGFAVEFALMLERDRVHWARLADQNRDVPVEDRAFYFGVCAGEDEALACLADGCTCLPVDKLAFDAIRSLLETSATDAIGCHNYRLARVLVGMLQQLDLPAPLPDRPPV